MIASALELKSAPQQNKNTFFKQFKNINVKKPANVNLSFARPSKSNYSVRTFEKFPEILQLSSCRLSIG